MIVINLKLTSHRNFFHFINYNLGKHLESKVFHEKREVLKQAMAHVFYNMTEGSWFDYNLRTKSHNVNFYPSMVVPLFGQCYQNLNLDNSQQIVKHLNARFFHLFHKVNFLEESVELLRSLFKFNSHNDFSMFLGSGSV